jgi:hypothetical protein
VAKSFTVPVIAIWEKPMLAALKIAARDLYDIIAPFIAVGEGNVSDSYIMII